MSTKVWSFERLGGSVWWRDGHSKFPRASFLEPMHCWGFCGWHVSGDTGGCHVRYPRFFWIAACPIFDGFSRLWKFNELLELKGAPLIITCWTLPLSRISWDDLGIDPYALRSFYGWSECSIMSTYVYQGFREIRRQEKDMLRPQFCLQCPYEHLKMEFRFSFACSCLQRCQRPNGHG